MSRREESAGGISWGRPEGSLALGLSAEGAFARLRLRNVGAEPLTVLSHVVADGFHLDWFRLSLLDDSGTTRALRLYDDRDESSVVEARLAAGESLEHAVDIQLWARRGINGGVPLATGAYQMSAEYEVEPEGESWSGRLKAGPVALRL